MAPYDVALHLAEKRYLYRSTMTAVADELEAANFLRIHRSYLVNTAAIKDIKHVHANQYRFILMNGLELVSSRSYKTQIGRALNDVRVRAGTSSENGRARAPKR